MTAVRKKHRPIPTDHGKNTLRARLSLHETQVEFAKRFMVSWMTVHNWETGKSKQAARIHRQLLKAILQRLMDEGRLMPLDTFNRLYVEVFERKTEQFNDYRVANNDSGNSVVATSPSVLANSDTRLQSFDVVLSSD